MRSSLSDASKSMRETTSAMATDRSLSSRQLQERASQQTATAFEGFPPPASLGSQLASDTVFSLLDSILQQATPLATALPAELQPSEAGSQSMTQLPQNSTSMDPRPAPSNASEHSGRKRSLLPLIAIPGALLVFLCVLASLSVSTASLRGRADCGEVACGSASVRQGLW
ncbi:hypothetical protein NUW54_g1920 [Trametes sanguinea]|uniref:Uncharacterized protein n=1 Tax=Trametes sanguinea TaxID=158606 RepID=A0ACC1Q6D6_9APHY|nr:hypothetical protein NUW54_g1920 [Trametes sanguinea]